MKKLTQYLAESAEWMATPAEGDDFAIELPDEVLCETYIIEVADNCILLDATPEIIAAIGESALLEDTDEGESGIVMETMGYGGLVGEDSIDPIIVKALEKMPKGLKGKGLPGDDVFDAARNALAMEYGLMKMRYDAAVTANYVRQLIDLYKRQTAVDKKGAYPGMDEAEYQGRKVALGKPMQGDVKKFKVYVRDPKTGNVKKVNFGDKTMRIKKSNPARRKSFRARHNCANPGPRTKARYWSCRKW